MYYLFICTTQLNSGYQIQRFTVGREEPAAQKTLRNDENTTYHNNNIIIRQGRTSCTVGYQGLRESGPPGARVNYVQVPLHCVFVASKKRIILLLSSTYYLFHTLFFYQYLLLFGCGSYSKVR